MDQPMDVEVSNKEGHSSPREEPLRRHLLLRLVRLRPASALVGPQHGRGGLVAFDAIDDARFGHAEEFRCLFVRRTRLLCRKCGASLGFGYDDRAASPRYDIKIRRVQPLVDARDHDAP